MEKIPKNVDMCQANTKKKKKMNHSKSLKKIPFPQRFEI